MYLKRFRASTVRDALRLARKELGSDALVLSTAMVAAAGWRGWMGGREVEITAAAERGASESRPSPSDDRPSPDSSCIEAIARLSAAGVEPELADEIVASLPKRARRGATLHSLRGALADRLAPLAAADDDQARIEVFVGPPGAGKTTTIAKIAAQARARRGMRLGLIAADGFRIGAVDQLRAYAGIIGSPFKVARTPADLDVALRSRLREPVLVDTAGRSPSGDEARELFRIIALRADVRTHLVLPADTQPASARRIFAAYEDARPSRIVLTKVDETESLSSLVNVLRERQLPISYLGTGQRVPDDLVRPTAELLAASMLGDSHAAYAS